MEYAKQTVNDLSADLMYSYLHEVALPALLNDRRAELVNPTLTMEQPTRRESTYQAVDDYCIQVDGPPWIQVQDTPKDILCRQT
jgi:hypothetical protein